MITVADSKNKAIEEFSSEDEVSFFIEDMLDKALLWSTTPLEMKPCHIITRNVYPKSWRMGKALSSTIKK